jgi:hypothetical protein
MSEIIRRLATVRTIDEIQVHPNADALELAIIDGWKVVVRKNEFNVGENILYIECDAFLPLDKRFEFLRESCFKSLPNLGEGFRVKTKKIRGVISQGLVFKLEEFPEILVTNGDELDLDKILGIVKYEQITPIQLAGQAKGNFPDFIPKTDEDRLQNIYKTLNRTLNSLNLEKIPEEYREKAIERFNELEGISNLKNETFETTLKLDGSSMTIFFNKGEFGVCSRNLQLKLEGNEKNSFVVKALKYKNKLPDNCNYALQGELVGPGINKNRLNLKNVEFYVFSMWNIDEQCYVSPEHRRNFCKVYELKHVPIIEENLQAFNVLKSIDDFVKYSDRESLNNTIAEGVVFKANNGKVHFKVINPKYLLKYED